MLYQRRTRGVVPEENAFLAKNRIILHITNMTKKLSIYVLEKPVRSWLSERAEFYHSCLALVNESGGAATDGPDFTPEQELHFMDDIGSESLTASVYTRERHLSAESALIGYIGGEEMSIRKLWNRALQVGVAVKRAAPEFDKVAGLEWEFNCRSGVEAALKAMGFEYHRVEPVAGKEYATPSLAWGLNKNLLGFVQGFMPLEKDDQTPEEILARAEALTLKLAPLGPGG